MSPRLVINRKDCVLPHGFYGIKVTCYLDPTIPRYFQTSRLHKCYSFVKDSLTLKIAVVEHNYAFYIPNRTMVNLRSVEFASERQIH